MNGKKHHMQTDVNNFRVRVQCKSFRDLAGRPEGPSQSKQWETRRVGCA